eukprot:12443663-Alexandrium_andersonii.AAC.1
MLLAVVRMWLQACFPLCFQTHQVPCVVPPGGSVFCGYARILDLRVYILSRRLTDVVRAMGPSRDAIAGPESHRSGGS